MRAIVVADGPDGPTLELAEVPVPSPGPTQVLIRVAASGLNRADLRRTQAHFKVSGPVVPGLEVTGEIIECGAEAAGFQAGDTVAAMAPGGYAEYAVADDGLGVQNPCRDAARTGSSSCDLVHDGPRCADDRGQGSRQGETVLVTAAASGIGIAAAQIAKAMGAEKLIGSVRRPKDNAAFLGLGWDVVSGGAPDDIRASVAAETGGRGADVVIDTVGSGILDGLMDAAALGGRIVSVGRMGGYFDQIDLDKLALRRISLVGVTFRTRSRAQKAAVRDAMLRDLWVFLEDGSITPPIDRVLALEEALAAQEHMKANRHFGKIVLKVWND